MLLRFRLLFGIICGMSYFVLHAQKDTVIVYDTVYLVKEPVVITHYDSAHPTYLLSTPWVSSGVGVGAVYYKGTPDLDGAQLLEFGFEVGSKIATSRFYSTLGLSYQRLSNLYRTQKEYQEYNEVSFVRNDTLGSYIHVVDNKAEVVYVIDKVSDIKTDTSSYFKTVTNTANTDYLAVALALGYQVDARKMSYGLYTSAVPAVLTSTLEPFQKQHTRLFMQLGMGAEISYRLMEKLSLTLRYEYRASTSSIYTSAKVGRQQSVGLLKIKFYL